MGDGARTATACAVCVRHHEYGPDGWYAGTGKERHPFTPPARSEQIITESRKRVDGNTSALFGALERCGRCKSLLEPDDAEWHRDWHNRLDEALGIAWDAVTHTEASKSDERRSA